MMFTPRIAIRGLQLVVLTGFLPMAFQTKEIQAMTLVVYLCAETISAILGHSKQTPDRNDFVNASSLLFIGSAGLWTVTGPDEIALFYGVFSCSLLLAATRRCDRGKDLCQRMGDLYLSYIKTKLVLLLTFVAAALLGLGGLFYYNVQVGFSLLATIAGMTAGNLLASSKSDQSSKATEMIVNKNDALNFWGCLTGTLLLLLLWFDGFKHCEVCPTAMLHYLVPTALITIICYFQMICAWHNYRTRRKSAPAFPLVYSCFILSMIQFVIPYIGIIALWGGIGAILFDDSLYFLGRSPLGERNQSVGEFFGSKCIFQPIMFKTTKKNRRKGIQRRTALTLANMSRLIWLGCLVGTFFVDASRAHKIMLFLELGLFPVLCLLVTSTAVHYYHAKQAYH